MRYKAKKRVIHRIRLNRALGYTHLLPQQFGPGTAQNNILVTVGQVQKIRTHAEIDYFPDKVQIYNKSLVRPEKDAVVKPGFQLV